MVEEAEAAETAAVVAAVAVVAETATSYRLSVNRLPTSQFPRRTRPGCVPKQLTLKVKA